MDTMDENLPMATEQLKQNAHLDKIDFTSSSTVKREFSTYEEAFECMTEFQNSLELEVLDKHVSVSDLAKQHVYWHESNIPYVVVQREKYEYYLLGDGIAENFDKDRQICYTVTIIELLNFPNNKRKTKKVRHVEARLIRHALSTGNIQFDHSTSFCVQFAKGIQRPTKLKNSQMDDTMQVCIDVEQNHKWVASIDECKIEIEKFENLTGNKFVQYARQAYDIAKSLIRWDKRDESTITPYIIKNSIWLECEHAKNRHKGVKSAKLDISSQLVDHQTTPKKKQRVTKKLNCGAKMFIQEVWKFPQFQVDKGTSNYNLKRHSRAIRTFLNANNEKLILEFACLLCFPRPEDHTGHVVKQEHQHDSLSGAGPHSRVARVFQTSGDNVRTDAGAARNETQDAVALLVAQDAEGTDECVSSDWVIYASPAEETVQSSQCEEATTTNALRRRFIELGKTLMELSYQVTSPELLEEGISDLQTILTKFTEACYYDSCFAIEERSNATPVAEKVPTNNAVSPAKRIKLNHFS